MVGAPRDPPHTLEGVEAELDDLEARAAAAEGRGQGAGELVVAQVQNPEVGEVVEEPVGEGPLQVAAREGELAEVRHAGDLAEEEVCVL